LEQIPQVSGGDSAPPPLVSQVEVRIRGRLPAMMSMKFPVTVESMTVTGPAPATPRPKLSVMVEP